MSLLSPFTCYFDVSGTSRNDKKNMAFHATKLMRFPQDPHLINLDVFFSMIFINLEEPELLILFSIESPVSISFSGFFCYHSFYHIPCRYCFLSFVNVTAVATISTSVKENFSCIGCFTKVAG